MKSPISAIILTYNEELHIERCLLSMAFWVDQIIIVDSGSKDKTVDIAKKYGAEVHVHTPFTNQADQFNWALENVEIKNNWILRMDCDEYVMPELAEEIQEMLKNDNPTINGYYMKRRVFFMNRWIKHGGYYPIWLLRLFRKGTAKYEAVEMDEHPIIQGEVGYLKNDIVDHQLRSLEDWTNKHINYSRREASVYIKGELEETDFSDGSQVQAKRWLKKNVYYRFPKFIRAFFYYIYRYIFKMGFLDGKEGMIFHFLQAFWYRFLVDARIYEYERDHAKS